MDVQLLERIGLTKTQAKAYIALIQKGELSPPEVAKQIGESRTNAYMILAKLEELELIEKVQKASKLTYQPLNPIALEKLAETNTHSVVKAEEDIKHSMPQMLSYFYSFTEKPGIRLLQGTDGLKEIYQDTLRAKQDIYFLRSPAEVKSLGGNFFERYKKRRAFLGIKTYAFTHDNPDGRKWSADDEINKMIRTWIKPEDYTAPVEIDVYGDKVAFLAFGEDAMGVIIQSPHIAEAMRQILRMSGSPEKT